MTYYPRDGRPLVNGHDMNTGGRGSTSRGDTAGGQDPTDSASRNHAAMRRRQIAEAAAAVSHNDAMQDVYAERSARKEAEQREAEEDAHWEKMRRGRDEQNDAVRAFEIEDPHPHPLGLPAPDDPETDLNTAYFETLAWEKHRDDYLARTEGEELAARISAGILRPWTR
ncbi:hypothetical protein ACFWUW_06525 [Streptomyces sp. NPDC058655]|uniref:hypothetical protein n=1 Tax=Streptomyces sp. NPDC058655 TaxID=3346577 RepID=UPI00364C3D88